jgi:hypothetical protein
MLLSGCASLPPMSPERLTVKLCNAYAKCQSFEDSGVIKQLENGTNETRVNYSIQFVRGKVFRMQLHADRYFDAGPYTLVFYSTPPDGWLMYDSLNLQWGGPLIETNSEVFGAGIAISYGLFPEIPQLLGLDNGDFRQFFPDSRYYKSATVTSSRLHGMSVYKLALALNGLSEDEQRPDIHEYWIDPKTYQILKERVRDWEDESEITTRVTWHEPHFNLLSSDAKVEFNPTLGGDDFAVSVYLDDLTLLRKKLEAEHVRCGEIISGLGTTYFSVDAKDFARARILAVKIIGENSLSVEVETTSGLGCEIFENGKKTVERDF